MKIKTTKEVEEEIDIPIKEADDYTDAEKIQAFDKLHKQAKEDLMYLVKEGYESKDASHYCYESVMNLLGKNVWHIINSIE